MKRNSGNLARVTVREIRKKRKKISIRPRMKQTYKGEIIREQFRLCGSVGLTSDVIVAADRRKGAVGNVEEKRGSSTRCEVGQPLNEVLVRVYL